MISRPLPLNYGLNNLARFGANETVLIMNSTGVAGAAAIRISQMMKAKTFVLAESEEEAQNIVAQYSTPRNQVHTTIDTTIPTQIGSITNGRGIDVVFSCAYTDGAISRECWRHITPFDRFVDFGRKNILKRSVLDTLPLHQGAHYLAFDLLDIFTYKTELLGSLLQSMGLYRHNLISVSGNISVKSITDLNSAVSSYSDGLTAGKTIISYKPNSAVLDVLPSKATLKFRPDATYLLVGCLGGLGRSLSSWMIEKGTKRFAFLSRSGTDSEQAAVLVKDLEAQGISCQVICGDATVLAEVKRGVESIPSDFPMRGVVQAAIVLKVRILFSR